LIISTRTVQRINAGTGKTHFLGGTNPMTPYALNDEFRSTIESLFDQTSMALDPLGADVGPGQRFGADVDTALPALERAHQLKTELETIVSQMAAESAEIGCDETTDTFRMQSIGILMALRELQRHFPELAN
jgi:hypothetical protein